MSENVTIVDHPLVQHKLSIMRDKDTPTLMFRQLVKEVAFFLGAEALRDLAVTEKTVTTPLETGQFPTLDEKKLCIVPILRAGLAFLDGLLELTPSARVGHVGLQRNHETLEAEEYYSKLPSAMDQRYTLMVDPMLATGNTAIYAADLLKKRGARRIKFMCLVAAPEGVTAFSQAHSDIPIVTAALDRQLNEKGYILPGLGDAGDRIFGTK